eukprot:6825235-Lingulodinium_polyedra.AAC.1
MGRQSVIKPTACRRCGRWLRTLACNPAFAGRVRSGLRTADCGELQRRIADSGLRTADSWVGAQRTVG